MQQKTQMFEVSNLSRLCESNMFLNQHIEHKTMQIKR